MLSTTENASLGRLRPLILLAVFFLLWAARGDLSRLASLATQELSRLSAECARR